VSGVEAMLMITTFAVASKRYFWLIVAARQSGAILASVACDAGHLGPLFFSMASRRRVALNIHLEDGGVVDEAIDGGKRHGGIGKDLPHSPNGWFVVISSERCSYRALMSSNNRLVSAWSLVT
jgi:hypothetical protein